MSDFSLDGFLPYLLNNAAESTSRAFSAHYRRDHGMTRAQWRIMAHLGSFGALTATEICRRGFLEKSKVSRAVAALEEAGLVRRAPSDSDRRAELLSLTARGRDVHAELSAYAQDFQSGLVQRLGPERAATLAQILDELIERQPD
ncbi:MarR family winged helix-turn-helix transcriptional regulator [Paracoccus sediminicola]|uniref:MarR family winged helix-turn-helix transcriptional regulator n=1 Tax=Paracoccus sediminicola TaxID=3017783 RepID=UPI0022F05A00|nr:MarR family winged helix-turn-helix transcriptional regulator [Paracoccus sediminicola]WBU56396.1 MarR family winged helix-turn-helix transcriptional regulator [Paracoccus sediminicola]